MNVQTYVRKPFYVSAVQVTSDNLFDVAEWCSGEVKKSGSGIPNETPTLYIKVAVIKPTSERQTQAFAGDWILRSGNNFKVYSNKAFKATFELNPDNPPHPE